MGESYGGIYVPTLTAKIVENQQDFKINLAGMAIGNGFLSTKLSQETSTKFLYNHGIIDELKWNQFEKECCGGCVDKCDFSNLTGHCWSIILTTASFNVYDIYRSCDSDSKPNLKEAIFDQNLLMTSKSSLKESGGIPCMNSTDITTYLNRKNVRKALHIPDKLPKWNICNFQLNHKYQKQYSDMAPFFQKIHAANVPILLYYGDTDLMCNFMMGQKFSAQLGFGIVEHEKPWWVKGQVGGFKTVYNGLTFTTIRGAGHMAPQWRAPETAHAIKQFVLNKPI